MGIARRESVSSLMRMAGGVPGRTTGQVIKNPQGLKQSQEDRHIPNIGIRDDE